MTAQATRDARTHARSSDPVERIKHDITHSPAAHVQQVQPCESDLAVGVRYMIAAARYRLHKSIDAAAEQAHRELRDAVSSAHRTIGKLTRKRVMR